MTSGWFEALRADDLSKVQQMLKSGAVDVNCKDQVRQSKRAFASSSGTNRSIIIGLRGSVHIA